MDPGSRRAVLTAFSANLGVGVAKFIAYGVTGASSMLAEAIHSVADSGNQLLLLLGFSRSTRAPTEEHPFGYGRERYFWAFVVSMVLFSLGSLFALYEGYQKLLHPHEIRSPEWAIGVLLLAIVLESVALRTAIQEAQKLRGKQGWWAFLRHSRNPEIPVILCEDTGALIGLVIALSGIGLTIVTGEPRWDAIGSLGIGALLWVLAIILAVEMQSLIIGESARDSDLAAIRANLQDDPRVRRLVHLRTQHLGPDELLVGAKLECDPALTLREVDALIAKLERQVREATPAARVIYIEPCTTDTAPETL